MARNQISQKKPIYPLSSELRSYLERNDRLVDEVVSYAALLDFQEATPLIDDNGRDTLWLSACYAPIYRDEIHAGLLQAYLSLRAQGLAAHVDHLSVERVDYCSFGNSHPFRVRVVNRFNDNYDHFYVKQADASRVFGLELEHLLSPNRMHYFIEGETLLEEHIAGVPGDRFISEYMFRSSVNKVRLAKEFVKFNERCFMRLLGDMRAQNYVVDITPDFEDEQYRIRAIDFDQQSHEGSHRIYQSHRWENNAPVVKFAYDLLNKNTIAQYRDEERVLFARRLREGQQRYAELIELLSHCEVSTKEKSAQLESSLAGYHRIKSLGADGNMGKILARHIEIMLGKG